MTSLSVVDVSDDDEGAYYELEIDVDDFDLESLQQGAALNVSCGDPLDADRLDGVHLRPVERSVEPTAFRVGSDTIEMSPRVAAVLGVVVFILLVLAVVGVVF